MNKILKYKTQLMVVFLLSLVVVFVACDSGRFISATRSSQYVVEGGVERGKVWKDYRQHEKIVITESLYTDGIHDPANAAIKTLQDPKEALSAFPLDRRGGVNWVRALDLGIINPRVDLQGKYEMLTMDLDIMFTDTGKMPWVRFPHLAHTKWLACANCHPKIFKPQKGANNPSMDGILAGEHCGRCHDKVAFALWTCERCHSVPHEGTPANWRENFIDAKADQ